tara:strand:+ start:157 stop:519 length:363 start_codon:yes stop_codon:yes gene_type:complete
LYLSTGDILTPTNNRIARDVINKTLSRHHQCRHARAGSANTQGMLPQRLRLHLIHLVCYSPGLVGHCQSGQSPLKLSRLSARDPRAIPRRKQTGDARSLLIVDNRLPTTSLRIEHVIRTE